MSSRQVEHRDHKDSFSPGNRLQLLREPARITGRGRSLLAFVTTSCIRRLGVVKSNGRFGGLRIDFSMRYDVIDMAETDYILFIQILMLRNGYSRGVGRHVRHRPVSTR